MKVLAIIGARKNGNTSYTVQELCRQMETIGEVEIEYLHLHDHDLKYCLGCRVCFDKRKKQPGSPILGRERLFRPKEELLSRC